MGESSPFAYEVPLVSQRKLAIVKLVAKHQVFDPESLASRNFDFLERDHALYPVYTSFVKQYEIVKSQEPPEANLLQRAIERASKMPPKVKIPKTKPATRAINWQNFMVLETVEFFSSDLNGSSRLSEPFTENDLALLRDTPKEPVFRSALTGEMVPESQYNEHIRTRQIDPSYYKQKEKEQKRSQSNLDYDHVAENLKTLKEKRQRVSE